MSRCLYLAGLLLVEQTAFAQQAIQQPVVGATTVGTSVSVPDRGRVFLGGVSSAASGRTQYGPISTGPASGYTRQGSSMSVGVYIHDLHAMDEAILRSVPSTAGTNRHKTEVSLPGPGLEREKETSAAEKAVKHEELARKAEEAGKPGVARLHLQMAAKYGSKVAEDRLAGHKTESKSVTPVNTK